MSGPAFQPPPWRAIHSPMTHCVTPSLCVEVAHSQRMHAFADVVSAWDALQHLETCYPGFQTWYWGKVVPGLSTGERSLLVKSFRGRVAGVAISKRDATEAKLCTLWVSRAARMAGVGRELMQGAIDWLEDDFPLFTVPAERIDAFGPLLKRFRFEETSQLTSVYRPGVTEHVFNGKLQSASVL